MLVMFRTTLALTSLLLLPVAASAQVRVDYDKQQDFTRYRTFDVSIGSLVRVDGRADEANTLTANRLRRAIARELQARGFESTPGGADLEVKVSARDTERVDIVRSGLHDSPAYWYRPVRYRGRIVYVRTPSYWRSSFYDDVWTRRYLEGSLTIDVIERDTGRLLYRAQVNDEIGSDLDKHIATSVDRAFKKFPVKELDN
jgi:hypothetical protein